MTLKIGRTYQLSDGGGTWVDRHGVVQDLTEFIPLSSMGHREKVKVHLVSGTFSRVPDGLIPHAGSEFTITIDDQEFRLRGRPDGFQELQAPTYCIDKNPLCSIRRPMPPTTLDWKGK